MKTRATQGRALFYTRDSSGKHEVTPGQYVAWAQREANRLGLTFSGTPQAIDQMIRQGLSASGDLFLDYGVSGNKLTRPGLEALKAEALRDSQVSHLFIPRRDRLARPDDPTDGMKLEAEFSKRGLTLVFMDKTVGPIKRGRKPNTAEQIVAFLEYDSAGNFRTELAQKILYAQIGLAKAGYSTGGRAPYGFRRWLAKEDGNPVRELADGEHVRMAGHHVVWLPGPEEEQAIIRRVLTMPASRVAATLTAEGVPPPDAGRERTDHGVRHATSGVWHANTVTNIARNPLLVAMCRYGTRSMGDRLRYSPTGPRGLEETDFRSDEKPKIIRNTPAERIEAPARFEPLVATEEHQKLQAILDRRAGTQRGKPRASDPGSNPLGCRVYDLNCTWPMYRTPYENSFRYTCGLYQQSHGQRCAHNHIDGPRAAQFVLACLRQQLFGPKVFAALKTRLEELAQADTAPNRPFQQLADKQAALTRLEQEIETASGNLARASSDAQYRAVATVFDKLQKDRDALKAELTTLQAHQATPGDAQSRVTAALALLERLTDLAASPELGQQVAEAIILANARLFLAFSPVQEKKRLLNKLTHGVV